jgi:hypothetical protein
MPLFTRQAEKHQQEVPRGTRDVDRREVSPPLLTQAKQSSGELAAFIDRQAMMSDVDRTSPRFAVPNFG